jgi:hypothetical protein
MCLPEPQKEIGSVLSSDQEEVTVASRRPRVLLASICALEYVHLLNADSREWHATPSAIDHELTGACFVSVCRHALDHWTSAPGWIP